MPAIGGLLNLYDLAVVQEDFAYHEDLSTAALHPHRSPALVPNEKIGIGDGLNTFSRSPFSRFERVTWRACNGKFSDGADCFAPKGFSVETHALAPGVEFDLYNLHMDSGHARRDIQARAAQADQLADYIDRRSDGRAVIVAGDTNMDGDSETILTSFLRRTGLSDACRTLGCADPERIDRVLYRSSQAVAFSARRFEVDRRFVRADGSDLSDHEAVGVAFHWATPDKGPVARAATGPTGSLTTRKPTAPGDVHD
jgi:endonuclease/exonuclease/phosphatase (EEP) superfamily protein YafD